jgi:hypothetical protein
MKTNQSSLLLVQKGAGSLFFNRIFVAALILALLVTLLPFRAALAAPASDGTSGDINDFEQAWSNKIEKVHYNSIFYVQVRVYPADFKDPDELAMAHEILNNYGIALRGAQRVILNGYGFNQKGKVVNEVQADQSLKELSEYLRQMRALKEKLDRLDGQYRLLPVSVTTSTASQ